MSGFLLLNTMGNLTRDPEIRTIPSGKIVVSCAIAVNYDPKKKPVFLEFKVWEKTGEAFAKYHTKGKQVFLSGDLEQEEWNDKNDGKPRTKFVLNVRKWAFAGGQGGGAREESHDGAPAAPPAEDRNATIAPDSSGFTGDMPF